MPAINCRRNIHRACTMEAFAPQCSANVSIHAAAVEFNGPTMHNINSWTALASLSLHLGDTFAQAAVHAERASSIFSDTVNGVRGGLQVGSRQHGVRFTFFGDSSDSGWARVATEYAVASNADFVTGPYSSDLTRSASQVSASAGKLMVASGAATASVIAANNLTFGFLPSATTAFRNPCSPNSPNSPSRLDETAQSW
eukprot:137589-Prymnesium_polylepis.2